MASHRTLRTLGHDRRSSTPWPSGRNRGPHPIERDLDGRSERVDEVLAAEADVRDDIAEELRSLITHESAMVSPEPIAR
jgi:hypothetical protein